MASEKKEQTNKKKDISDYFKQEKEEKDMINYLKSLGLDPNYEAPEDDDRKIVVEKLTIDFKSHDAVAIPASSEDELAKAAKTVIRMKADCQYRFQISFRVQHTILEAFKITSNVKKLKKKLVEDTVKLGSYPPSKDFKTISIPNQGFIKAPSVGFGDLHVKVKFGDTTSDELMVLRFLIKIVKEWD